MSNQKKNSTSLEGFSALKNFNLAQEQTDTDTDTAPKTEEPSTLPQVREKIIDDLGRAYSTGKRKSAIARVWIKPGKGILTVNGRSAKDYFASAVREMVVTQPFEATNTTGTFDVVCTVKGGGLSGQAGAIRHGIARALQAYDPSLRTALKPLGLLTRDARRVERKKFGRRKARRSFQFSKR